MSINPKIAEALGMDVPEEVKEDHALVNVAPHELPEPVANEEAPDMTDIERTTLEGEKQLEKIIAHGLNSYAEMEKNRNSVDPRFEARFNETGTERLRVALDAVKIKLDNQNKKKELRLKEAGFQAPGQNITQQNNFFVGSREELRKMIQTGGQPSEQIHDIEETK